MDDGGPAFPRDSLDGPDGMSLRDWLVGQALGQSAVFLIRHSKPSKDNNTWDEYWVEDKAVKAYVDAAEEVADEYLQKRS